MTDCNCNARGNVTHEMGSPGCAYAETPSWVSERELRSDQVLGENEPQAETREVVTVGWDGQSRPMLRYRDELHLPDHRRSIVTSSDARHKSDVNLDPDSDEFMELVEAEWFRRMQGDLDVVIANHPDGYDHDLRVLIVHIAEQTRANLEMTKGSLDQFDVDGEVIADGIVTDEELARRIVGALLILFYGGN